MHNRLNQVLLCSIINVPLTLYSDNVRAVRNVHIQMENLTLFMADMHGLHI